MHLLLRVLASAGLVVLAAISPLGGLFVMAGDSCGEHDQRLICSADWQGVVGYGPMLTGTIGLVVGLVGVWIWPRRRRWLWLTLGYVIAVVGLCAAYVVATAG
jgi:hypothetical protein